MAQITANYNDRDSANLALMRLRRGGIDFDLVSLNTNKEKNNGELQPGISYPLCFGLNNSIPTASITCPQSREDVYPDGNPTEMQISVKSSQLQQAWDVLRNTGANDIRSRN
ncbi:MAG: hypothetical protein AB7D36_03230 [Oscillospiraceae bacterium]